MLLLILTPMGVPYRTTMLTLNTLMPNLNTEIITGHSNHDMSSDVQHNDADLGADQPQTSPHVLIKNGSCVVNQSMHPLSVTYYSQKKFNILFWLRLRHQYSWSVLKKQM